MVLASAGWLAAVSPAGAAAHAWQGADGSTTTPTSGGWNEAGHWKNGLPAHAADSELDFNASAGNARGQTPGPYTAANDTGAALPLNVLLFNNQAPVGSTNAQTVQVTGDASLDFVANAGTNPTLVNHGLAGFKFYVPITLSAPLTSGGSAPATASSLVLFGAISGPKSLTHTGAYTLQLCGANTYSGGTAVNGLLESSVAVAGGNGLGTGPITFSAGKLTVDTVAQTFPASQALTLEGAATIVGNCAAVFRGPVTLGSNILTLRQTVAATATISGVIGGTGDITNGVVTGVVRNDPEQGDGGGWVLTGNNTYTGATLINGGRLSITGTTSGQGNYSVSAAAGSTTAAGLLGGTLGGNGTVGLAAGGTVKVNGVGIGGTNYRAQIGPSDATGALRTVGSLTVTAAGGGDVLTVGALGNYVADVAGKSGSDRITLGSATAKANLILSPGATLALNSLPGAFDGSKYVIAHCYGKVTGTFTILTIDGAPQVSATTFTKNGYKYNVLYNQADPAGGFDIVLSR